MKRWWVQAAITVIAVGMIAAGTLYFRPVWVGLQITHMQMWESGCRSHNVELAVGRIHYYEAMPAKDATQISPTPLVLVHGLGSRSEEWALMIPGLTHAGFHVYALDLLGFGQSAQPDVNYSIPLQEEVLREFLDSQHLNKVDLAGWSMGGLIVMHYTLDHPERVRRLVDFDSLGLFYHPTFRLDLFELHTPQQLDELWSYLSPQPAHFPPYIARDAIRENGRIAWVIHRTMANLSIKDAMDNKAGEIKQPVLLIWGEMDRITPVSLGYGLHNAIPQSVLEIEPGIGHRTPLDGAGMSVPAVVDFLRADPPMAAQEKTLSAAK